MHTIPELPGAPPQVPQRTVRVVRVIGIVVALLGVVLGAAILVVGLVREPERAGDRASTPARGTPVTPLAALPADLDLQAWAGRTTGPTGVPARALIAYGSAERLQRAATPECGLSWATLAGVGRVESDHGRLGRADLDADGVARPSVVGVPLDGSPGLAEIPDTDAGRLDGDAEYDRAVGPMQFLPATWARYGADGDGDGARDPDDLDDAARRGRPLPVRQRAGHGRRRRLVGRRARLQPIDRLRAPGVDGGRPVRHGPRLTPSQTAPSRSCWPQYSPSRRPGGQANTADPVCWM